MMGRFFSVSAMKRRVGWRLVWDHARASRCCSFQPPQHRRSTSRKDHTITIDITRSNEKRMERTLQIHILHTFFLRRCCNLLMCAHVVHPSDALACQGHTTWHAAARGDTSDIPAPCTLILFVAFTLYHDHEKSGEDFIIEFISVLEHLASVLRLTWPNRKHFSLWGFVLFCGDLLFWKNLPFFVSLLYDIYISWKRVFASFFGWIRQFSSSYFLFFFIFRCCLCCVRDFLYFFFKHAFI